VRSYALSLYIWRKAGDPSNVQKEGGSTEEGEASAQKEIAPNGEGTISTTRLVLGRNVRGLVFSSCPSTAIAISFWQDTTREA